MIKSSRKYSATVCICRPGAKAGGVNVGRQNKHESRGGLLNRWFKNGRGSGDHFGKEGRVEEGGLFSFHASVSFWLITLGLLMGRLSSITIYLKTRETVVNKNTFLRLVSEIAYCFLLRPEHAHQSAKLKLDTVCTVKSTAVAKKNITFIRLCILQGWCYRICVAAVVCANERLV